MLALGIEGTAHTFGVGIIRDNKIIADARAVYKPPLGKGIHPTECAAHHRSKAEYVLRQALSQAAESLNLKSASDVLNNIDFVSYSAGPGLAPCLKVVMEFARDLAKQRKKPLVPVNHCVAHIEIGRMLTGAQDPIVLYVSGGNTQIIGYAAQRYRVFGETMDIAVGNAIDTFARECGLPFPGGPEIERLAEQGKNYIELPYVVKGMDLSFSGIVTAAVKKWQNEMSNAEGKEGRAEKMSKGERQAGRDIVKAAAGMSKDKGKEGLDENVSGARTKKAKDEEGNSPSRISSLLSSSLILPSNQQFLADLCFSFQETVYAMLTEVTERALAHTGKSEVLLTGGVAASKRLNEMLRIMCKERGARFFSCPMKYTGDNGVMIAAAGMRAFEAGERIESAKADSTDFIADSADFNSKWRTDEVEIKWME